MRYLLLLCFSICAFGKLQQGDRRPYLPYISGDAFRHMADHIYDETNLPFEPKSVKKGDVIFVKVDHVFYFLDHYHKEIANPYILITHNGDNTVPGRCEHYLDDSKLIRWFGQNGDTSHPKFTHIPIGMANRLYDHGNLELFDKLKDKAVEKDILLYANFGVGTNPGQRTQALHFALKNRHALWAWGRKQAQYLEELHRSKFVMSPVGNGLDCHRTWEALVAGGIPVVTKTPICPLYDDLPILVIDDWNDLTPEFLEAKYEEMRRKPFKMEKAYFKYWRDLIEDARPVP